METKRLTSKEIVAYLVEKFPECFSFDGPAKPLKVGIFQDLTTSLENDEVVSKTRLRQALRHYTSSWRYLKSIKVGKFRVDLTGAEVEEIDQSQADYASKTLKESQDKFANNNPKDNTEKKDYKNKKPAVVADVKHKDKAKSRPKKENKRAESKPSITLKNIDAEKLTVGMKVKVRIGQAPMEATIREVSGNDVSVELATGMTVKTQIQHIFTE